MSRYLNLYKGMQIIQSLSNKTNLFSPIFVRSKFRKFRVLEKVAKIITREKKESAKINKRNLTTDYVRKQNMHGF